MISDIDLLKATARREKCERMFYYADFVPAAYENAAKHFNLQEGEDLWKKLGFFRRGHLYPERKQAAAHDFSQYFADIAIPEGVSISDDGVLHLPGSMYHFTHLISPLRNIYDEGQLRAFPVYRNPNDYDFACLARQVEDSHKQGLVASAFVGRLFEAAWPYRGYENLLADMLAEPDVAEYFIGNEHKWNMRFAEEAAIAGCDLFCFGDDVGTQNGMTFSADLWRRMLKPKWAETFALIKRIKPDAVIWYHSCGNISDIIGDLIEIGLDILNPIQPECMDLHDIHKQYGDKLSFDGGISTQRIMPYGTPADVVRAVNELADLFGGGLILAPAHTIEPEVSAENIAAFVETAQKRCGM